MKESHPRTSNCPRDDEWMTLIAGLLSDEKTEGHLQHATQCEHCGPLLKIAADLFAEDRSPEEEELLAKLSSSEPLWQRRLAQKIQLSAGTRPEREISNWRRGLRWAPILAASCGAVLVLAIGLRWVVRTKPQPQANASLLLALAYSEQRTIEPRIGGAIRAPVRNVRGPENSRLSRPPSLLEAESLIAKSLKSDPDDLGWLHLEGVADLLDNNYESARSTLERAHRYSPNDPQITIDLASAYLLRGDQYSQPADYGQAVELLGQVLQKHPQDQLALFNRAIALERIFLYQQAEDDWRAYLKLDSTSAWADEARDRLATLEGKIRQQNDRSQEPLLEPERFVSAVRSGEESALRQIDDRVERYLDVALEHWVPQTISREDGVSQNSSSVRDALISLSQFLISRHSDYWLANFLDEIKARPQMLMGARFLVRAISANKTPDINLARQLAKKSLGISRETESNAAGSRALFEITYADQLSHETHRCKEEAADEVFTEQLAKYAWLRVQLLLEFAACSDLSDERARRLTIQAMQLAKQHRYSELELRAATFLAGLYQFMGDTKLVWKHSYAGLDRYWKGTYLSMRGYSLYAGLDLVAEENQQWYLDVALIREALEMIRSDPDVALRAIEQNRLARALMITGRISEAENNFHEAQALFVKTPEGQRKDNVGIETQIGLAGAETLRAHPERAIVRLERIRPQINEISDVDLSFEFFKNLGLAYFAVEDSSRAEQSLMTSLKFSEEALPSSGNERERLIWSRKTDPAYRAMVRIRLRESPLRGLAQWEWYKSASLRSERSRLSAKQLSRSVTPQLRSASETIPANSTLITYAVFEDGITVWTYNRTGVTEHWVDIPENEIGALARLFAEHCSHPDSNIQNLRSEARILYDKLFRPIDSVVSGYQHLIIEPDRELWLVPFEVLVGQGEQYLEDRFALSYSTGLDYLNRSPIWPGISYQDHALVVGNAAPGKDWIQLPEIEAEAKGIAARFRYNHLLLQSAVSTESVSREFREVDVFHFSGHATTLTDGPGLILGNSQVLDVGNFKEPSFRNPKLVVLSACSSANGATGVFEDQDSLARLLFGSGVPEVVASRWMVDSRATAELMNDFYNGLFSGESVSGSLRKAVGSLKDQKEYSHPFYWAGFTAFGRS